MLKFFDLLFFLFSTIGFFILLIILDYIGLKENLNLFLSSIIYGLINIIYAFSNVKLKNYLFLISSFYFLIIIIGNINEILLIYSGVSLSILVSLLFKNKISFKQLKRVE